PAVPYFQILLISGIFYPIHKYNLNICYLKGRSDLVLRLSMLHNSLLLVGALSAIWLGIYGLLYSLVIVTILITIINSFVSGRLISYDLKSQFLDLLPILLLNTLLGLTIYFLQQVWFYKFSDLWNIVASIVVLYTLYFSIAFIIKMNVVNNLLFLIKKEA